MHTRVAGIELDGFAMTAADSGQAVEVQVKDWATSESPLFYIYAEQIASIIFNKLGILNFRDLVNRYVVLIHPDNTADIYANDFAMATTLIPNRPLKAGEMIYVKDIHSLAHS